MSQWEKCRVALRDYPRLMFGTAVLISVALIAWCPSPSPYPALFPLLPFCLPFTFLFFVLIPLPAPSPSPFSFY